MRTWGNAPYGYRGVVKLEKVPEEQAILRRMKELRDKGKSFRDIADSLNAGGFKTRRGTEWRFQYVANVLKEQ